MKTVIIAGQSFELSTPYATGHVLTEAEALAFNQLRHENIRNNVAKVVKEAYATELPEAIASAQEKVAAYDAEYTFRIGGGGGTTVRLDPVEREARAIAKELVRDHLAKSGRNFKSIPEGMSKEDWEAKLEENINKVALSEKVLAEAKKVVSAKAKRLSSLSEELDLI